MKTSLTVVMILIITLISSVYSEEHGKISVQSEINPLTLSDFADLFSSSGSLVVGAPCKIGLRFYPISKLGIEIMGGIILGTSHKSDSATNTYENPGTRMIQTIFGLNYEAFQGEKAILGIIGRFGLDFLQASDYAYSGRIQKFAKYNLMIPSVFIGFEPSYAVSENIFVFSNFGVKMIFVPNSKEINSSDPSYNFSTGSLPLRSKKDANTKVITNGLIIGLRYFF